MDATAHRPVDGDAAVRRAVLGALTLAIGYVPFALVIGSTATEQGAPVAGWSGSWLIFGGSAHLAAMRTLGDSGPLAAILTGLVINARLAVYSASLGRRWSSQPRWFQLAAAPMIVDPTWAMAERQAAEAPGPSAERRCFLAAAGVFGAAWSAAVALGALVGARLDGVDLRFVVPLCLLALLGRGLADVAGRWVMAAATLAAIVGGSLPAGSGVLLAVAAGAAAGAVADARREGAGARP
jgi:predicted branched-subunit amino acid permease